VDTKINYYLDARSDSISSALIEGEIDGRRENHSFIWEATCDPHGKKPYDRDCGVCGDLDFFSPRCSIPWDNCNDFRLCLRHYSTVAECCNGEEANYSTCFSDTSNIRNETFPSGVRMPYGVLREDRFLSSWCLGTECLLCYKKIDKTYENCECYSYEERDGEVVCKSSDCSFDTIICPSSYCTLQEGNLMCEECFKYNDRETYWYVCQVPLSIPKKANVWISSFSIGPRLMPANISGNITFYTDPFKGCIITDLKGKLEAGNYISTNISYLFMNVTEDNTLPASCEGLGEDIEEYNFTLRALLNFSSKYTGVWKEESIEIEASNVTPLEKNPIIYNFSEKNILVNITLANHSCIEPHIDWEKRDVNISGVIECMRTQISGSENGWPSSVYPVFEIDTGVEVKKAGDMVGRWVCTPWGWQESPGSSLRVEEWK